MNLEFQPIPRRIMMQIETPRLRLRPWIDDDFEPCVAMCADPRVMKCSPSIFSREDTEAMCKRINEHFAKHGFGPWAIEVEGQFAGLARVRLDHPI